jgi:copper ion binding protein
VSSNTIQEVTLSAPDISCAHCAMMIEETLGELPGISRVAVAVGDREVQLSYDASQVSLTEIEAAMDEAGYPVEKSGA